MSARHGSLADGHGAMAMPMQLDTIDTKARSPFPQTPHLNYGSTRVGPISVQNQVLHTGTADWLLDVPDASTDSGFYSNPSIIEPDPSQVSTFPGAQIHSVPSHLSHLGTTGWGNGSLNVAPWFPGSRTDPDLDVDVSFRRESVSYPITESLDESNPELLAYEDIHHDVSIADTSEFLADHLAAKSVSGTGTTICGRCGKQFTGQYQRGNYARHVKQQHRDVLKSLKQRTCRECKKVFKRQDARRKHEWIVHGLQDSQPCPRRPKSTQHGSRRPSHADLDETTSQQKMSTSSPTSSYGDQAGPIIPCYRVPMYSGEAQALFLNIRASLDINTFNSFCETILVRWEQIVEEMRQKRSEAYGPFARVLNRLSMQIRPEHPSHLNAVVPSNGPLNDAELKSKPASRVDRGKGSVQASKPSGSSSKRTAKMNRLEKFGEQSGAQASIMLIDPPIKPKKRKVDCPVHKYYTMVVQQSPSHPQAQSSSKPPCGGCRQEFMSQIRHHLRSSEKHRNFFSALEHCERCHEYVVEGETHDGQSYIGSNHESGTCPKRDESRESLVVCWARLYLAIFPRETSVPSPYTDDLTWLSDEEIRPLLASMRRPSIHIQGPALADQSSASFLGGQQPHQHSLPRHDVAPEQNHFDVVAEMAAESTILNDVHNFAQWFFAGGHAQTAPDIPSNNEVEAEYRMRQEHPRLGHRTPDEVEVNVNPNQVYESSFLSPPPVTGNMRKPSIDATTQPSTRYHGNTTTSFATSSQTSWSMVDDSSFTNQAETPWASMVKNSPSSFGQFSFHSPQSMDPNAATPSSSFVHADPSSSQLTEQGNEMAWTRFLSDDLND